MFIVVGAVKSRRGDGDGGERERESGRASCVTSPRRHRNASSSRAREARVQAAAE